MKAAPNPHNEPLALLLNVIASLSAAHWQEKFLMASIYTLAKYQAAMNVLTVVHQVSPEICAARKKELGFGYFAGRSTVLCVESCQKDEERCAQDLDTLNLDRMAGIKPRALRSSAQVLQEAHEIVRSCRQELQSIPIKYQQAIDHYVTLEKKYRADKFRLPARTYIDTLLACLIDHKINE